MAKFVKGEVVVVPFPFSDLSRTKRRPARVIAELDGDDIILCQITSRPIGDRYAVSLEDDDFITGGLHQKSNVRPNRLFTTDQGIVLSRVGSLKPNKVAEILSSIFTIIRGE